MSDRSRIHKKRYQSLLKLEEYVKEQHLKNVSSDSKIDWSLPLVCDASGAGESSCRIERTQEILKTDERAVDRLFTNVKGRRINPTTTQFPDQNIKQIYTKSYQNISSVHVAVAKEEILSQIPETAGLPPSVILRVDRTNIIITGQITERWYQIECDASIPLLLLFIQAIPPVKKLNNHHYISHSPAFLPLEDVAQTQKITFGNGTVFARKVLRHTFFVGTGTLEPFWHYTLPRADGTNLYYHIFPPVQMLNHQLSRKQIKLSVDMFIRLLVRRGGSVHCDIRRRNIAVIDQRLVLIDDHKQDGGEYLASNPYYYDCGTADDLVLPTTFFQDLLAAFRVMASISGCVYPWSINRDDDAVTLLFDKDMKLSGDKYYITMSYGDIYQLSVLMRMHMRRLARPSIDIESMILKHVSTPTTSQLISFRCQQEASGISDHVDG